MRAHRDMVRMFWTVVAIGWFGSLWSECAHADEADGPKLEISVLAGGQVAMGTDANTGVAPTLSLAVQSKLAAAERAPKVLVEADLAALPGEAQPDLGDLESFRSLEFRFSLLQQLPVLWADLYAEAGFATRLPGDPTPRDKTVRFASAGVRLGRSKAGDISVGLGVDQRLDGLWQPTVVVRGGVRLYQPKGLRAEARFRGEAILALQTVGYGAPRDLVRLSLVLGLGR